MAFMNRKKILLILLSVLAPVALLGSRQRPDPKNVLVCPGDEQTAIRFFYNNEGNYFHFPLIFRAVRPSDVRLNTAPMRIEGRTVFISLPELQQLVEGLAHSGLSWQRSEKVEALGSFKNLQPWSDTMEIVVVCSKGTERSAVDPKKICRTLRPLDAALKTPRALWEFQGFRVNYNCKVPGFKEGEFEDDH